MSKTAILGAMLLPLMIILPMSCSDDSGTDSSPEPQTVSGTIGPDGDILEIAGVVSLAVPIGALSGDVNFTITRNDSPPAPDGSLGPVSPDFTIKPSGTNFNVPAVITLVYNPASTGGGEEHEIKLYTHDGSNWSELTTLKDTAANKASANIDHLSDFCAMVDTTTALSEGDVYAKLVVAKTVTYVQGGGSGVLFEMDQAIATFDSAYAPCVPILPIHNVSVTCEDYDMEWYEESKQYWYPAAGQMPIAFITLDEYYHFVATPGSGVSALNDSILFPSLMPYISNLTNESIVSSSSDLTVEWDNSGSGVVELILISLAGDSAFFVETNNDGSYVIASSHLDPGKFALTLNHYNMKNISASGYDPRGFLAARVMNTVLLTIE